MIGKNPAANPLFSMILAMSLGVQCLAAVPDSHAQMSVAAQKLQESRPQEPERDRREPTRAAENPKSYSLSVTVHGQGTSSQPPVKSATVTLFAGDHTASNKTDNDGKITFKFNTAAKMATVRVIADDRWQPYQQQVDLDDPDKQHKVLLKPSD